MTSTPGSRDDVVREPLDRWDRFWLRFADVPWGLIIFAIATLLTLLPEVDAADLRALATAAGLFGVGHGIHTGAKHLRH